MEAVLALFAFYAFLAIVAIRASNRLTRAPAQPEGSSDVPSDGTQVAPPGTKVFLLVDPRPKEDSILVMVEPLDWRIVIERDEDGSVFVSMRDGDGAPSKVYILGREGGGVQVS